MSYLVLARKYRPKNFSEMVGQSHVVQALGNALRSQRLHHAYLFTGTRGVGKTTVSRILAKSLNCVGLNGQGGITDQPCGVCQACTDIDTGRFVDYTELDAASNRGVDEIAQLLEQAVYKPVVGRFKVFMIDEVHMLTNTAFNAMLKTLEEPPDYLKFVLATTDPQKVPATVLSRCLQFNLRPMAPETVMEHLQHVLASEQINAEPQALRLLSRAARGSMRDALSLTDQAIAFGSGQLDEVSVRTMLGSVDRSYVFSLIDALARNDGRAVVDTSEALRLNGLSAASTLEDMTTVLQRMAVLQAVPSTAAEDDADPEAVETARLAGVMPADETQLLYSLCLHGRGELGLAPDEYAALTMVLLRLLAFKPLGTVVTPATPRGAAAPSKKSPAPAKATRPRLSPDLPAAAPAQVVGAATAQTATAQQNAATGVNLPSKDTAPWEDSSPTADHPEPVPATLVQASALPLVPASVLSHPIAAELCVASLAGVDPHDAADVALGELWNNVVTQLIAAEGVVALTRELALQSELRGRSEGVWCLRVERELLTQSSSREKLLAALQIILPGEVLALSVETGPVGDTPARRSTAAGVERQRVAETTIHNDPFVQDMIRHWGAKIVPGSIKALSGPAR